MLPEYVVMALNKKKNYGNTHSSNYHGKLIHDMMIGSEGLLLRSSSSAQFLSSPPTLTYVVVVIN